MARNLRPSLLGSLLWIGFGILFLLRNLGIGPDVWSLAVRYWPVLLILFGIAKIVDYFLHKDSVSIRFGEIVGIFLVLLAGSALTGISESHFVRIVREMPIQIGGKSMRPGQWIGETHAFTDEMTYALDRTLPITVENAYGSVSVSPGSDGEIRVRLKKVIYGNEARAKSISEEIRLEGKPETVAAPGTTPKPEADPGSKSGAGHFVIRTNREDLSGKDYTFNTDMEILVPKESSVRVRNSFGEVSVTDIKGDLDLGTTHQEMEVRDCTGQFTISNRFGDTRLTNLTGNLNLDARGKVYIEKIKGNVTASNEYSPLEILEVDGEVVVSNTEGNIRLERITKAVTVNSRGSEVAAHDLKGGLKIDASHKNVILSGVASDIVIESRFASVSLKDARGNVTIDSDSDRISAENVRGAFKFRGRASDVQVTGADGPLEIRNSLKNVAVSDFSGACVIHNEFAGIRVATRKLGSGDVVLQNRNGDVELLLPDGASFAIDATARYGSVQSGFAGLEPLKSGETSTVRSRIGTGGPKFSVETTYGSIRLHPGRGAAADRPVEREDPVPDRLRMSRLPSAGERNADRSRGAGELGVAL